MPLRKNNRKKYLEKCNLVVTKFKEMLTTFDSIQQINGIFIFHQRHSIF